MGGLGGLGGGIKWRQFEGGLDLDIFSPVSNSSFWFLTSFYCWHLFIATTGAFVVVGAPILGATLILYLDLKVQLLQLLQRLPWWQMEIGGTVAFQRLNVLVHYLEEKRKKRIICEKFSYYGFLEMVSPGSGDLQRGQPIWKKSSLRFKVLTQALIDRLTRRKWVGETDNKKPCLFLLLLP